MSNGEHKTVSHAARTAARVIEGRAVVIVIDERKLHALNQTGTRVWELAHGRQVSQIVDQIVQEFAVDRETASRDVLAFLNELEARGAIRIGDAP